MKRLYFPLIAMAMATPTLCHAYNTWGGADYTDDYLGVTWDKTWTRAGGLQNATTDKAASWMADLPDNMFVAHVSIPGAHDFATGEDNWVSSVANGPASSTTQAVTMREQMDRGIRGIDLRPLQQYALLQPWSGPDRKNPFGSRCRHGILPPTASLGILHRTLLPRQYLPFRRGTEHERSDRSFRQLERPG